MHRLISARNLYQTSLHNLSLPPNKPVNRSSDIKCSFCRKILLGQHNIENLLVARHQSTRTASVLKALKKKGKHKIYKKYGELLEVGAQAMTETKVSISKLRAIHLSKLADSPVSLGQLHQLTTKPKKSVTIEVDPELLQSVKEKILRKPTPIVSTMASGLKEISLEDDQCALIYTNHEISSLEHRIKTKQYIDMVKESYYNFRKATLYDQRLQDLRHAINEGLTQEFDMTSNDSKLEHEKSFQPLPKSPHTVFRELFIENHLDSYDQELLSSISNLQNQGLAHPSIEDIYDEPALHGDLNEAKDLEFEQNEAALEVKKLKIRKAKQAINRKNKVKQEKRRAMKEVNMKTDMKELELRGKQEALEKLLAAHLQLLCSLSMVQEARKVLQYYRQRRARVPDHPKITDIKVYNTLLHGYAFMGMLDQTQDLLSSMAEDGIEPNAQTFAATFECIERSNIADKVQILNHYHQIMKEKGISLNDLLDKTQFVYDQRELVFRAVHRIDAQFTPQYTPPELDYDCPLMEKLKLDALENRQGLLESPAEGLLTLEEMKERGRKQLEIELNGEIEIQNIDVKDDASPTIKLYREKLRATESEWRDVVRESFTRHVSTLRSQSNASHSAITLYPYLKVLEVEQFVELVMGEIYKLVDGSESYSPTLKLLQRELGSRVYQKYQLEQYRKNGVLAKISQIYEQYCEWYVDRRALGGAPLNGRQAWLTLVHRNREGASVDVEEAPWPMEVRQNVGKFLYNIIINDVKIDVNMFKTKAKPKKLPAVYKVHRPWGRLVRLELKPHPALARLWLGAARTRLRMRAALVPPAAPPRPWAHLRAGAYLVTATPLVRMPLHVRSQWRRLERARPAALAPALDSLNQLGEVPWVVNRRVLDLQLQIFRSGGNKKLDIPPPASALDTSAFGAAREPAAVLKRRAAVSRARAEMHSLWCDALYKLALADHYRDEIFWLPHNLDFRGRVYACPPHLSQLSADAYRALLKFARARPLGPHGLRWLKLHAVNLTGAMKKHTVDERLAYADSILDKMLDSADRPLDGAGWWRASEEPWQTLACCMEIADAVRSPNHEEHLCGFPVHQDGSCNGLQHYAALGGDAAGAAAVNLAPRARPQDVYAAVCALVEEMRRRDAAAGVPAAVVLENFVRRKVIKQTVMTTVYGVTRFGARLQIAKQLKDIDEFPKEHVWACSQYLTTRTFDSLREMFTSTKLIQDWFTDCANPALLGKLNIRVPFNVRRKTPLSVPLSGTRYRQNSFLIRASGSLNEVCQRLISGVCGESVEWVTPLGLPVVQPYYRRAAATHTPLDFQQRPCTMKQRNAFPPNFIHSLDSTHMMLTALHCQAAAVAFVSVHDCYWTHPCSVALMNQICREQFVALHSQPILENLSEFLVKKYSYDDSELEENSRGAPNKKRVNSLLRKVPSKGDFKLESVLDSVYFFS